MAFAADRFVVRDEAAFAALVPPDAAVEKLAGDMQFTEGPVWVTDRGSPEGGFLLFSDQPTDSIRRWSRAGGATVFRQPADHPNGHTLDLDGRVIGCQQRPRRVARLGQDLKTWTPLIERWEGKRFNSPNDVVVKRDGTIWFTDPPYGLPKGQAKEMPGNYVFRFDPATGDVRPVATDFDMPNGLCFSPDESKLYVADSGKPHHVRVFHVAADGSLTGGNVFAVIDKGVPDGMRCDGLGNLWSSAADGVHVFAPDGKLLGKILVPETVANLVFGGPDGNTVFMTASKSLYAVHVNVTGADRR
ncbi:MAG TPA: SMP-30/gluconolactonase/LRE family protein [Tepidisphaeraceae bacterium]|nr:SMP-30/gluconolactonase/LRE family protein [Tepidisphaeraceae bacterium]